MDFLKELNDPQREAAEQINGPMMVIAGAGSGKTRVLTYRIAHLMSRGVDPFRILALTFTNKAAREMKMRAVKSYFRINTSPRIKVDRVVTTMMDVAVFAESKIRLRYGTMLI